VCRPVDFIIIIIILFFQAIDGIVGFGGLNLFP
jgi:hypothetical protein